MSFFNKKDKKPKTKKIPRDTSSDALEQGRVEKYSAHKRTDFVRLYSFKVALFIMNKKPFSSLCIAAGGSQISVMSGLTIGKGAVVDGNIIGSNSKNAGPQISVTENTEVLVNENFRH